MVLFFYPKALTSGCTKESCHFRDLAKEFATDCVDKNAAYIEYVGTNNSARDMDGIRAALGEAFEEVAGVVGVAERVVLEVPRRLRKVLDRVAVDRGDDVVGLELAGCRQSRHDLGDILRESLEHEKNGLALYRDVLEARRRTGQDGDLQAAADACAAPGPEAKAIQRPSGDQSGCCSVKRVFSHGRGASPTAPVSSARGGGSTKRAKQIKPDAVSKRRDIRLLAGIFI